MKHGSRPEKILEILKKFRRKHVRKHPSGTIPGIHEKIDDELRTRQGSYEKGFQSLTQDWKPKIITRCGA